MTFVAIPDVPASPAVVAALEARFGAPIAAHPSGAPWVFGDRASVEALRVPRAGGAGLLLVAAVGPSAHAGPGEQDGWTLACRDGRMDARGSLSTSRRICWTEHHGAYLVSDRADTLSGITGAGLDPGRLMLSLCDSLPALPFAASTLWSGISALLPGEALRISVEGARRERYWAPPPDDLGMDETAALVRAALTGAIRDATRGAGSISCDLSGGLDSTSLAHLLGESGASFSTYASFTQDFRNADRAWAERARDRIPGARHHELTGSSQALRSFDPDGIGARSDEPLLWKANIAYLQELATALGRHKNAVHLNGLGGDELFTFLPGALHAAWGSRRPDRRRLVSRARAMNRWGRLETSKALRLDQTFSEHLRQQGRSVAAARPMGGPAVCGWLPPVRVTRLASERTRTAVADQLMSVPADLEPHARTHGHHQVMEGVAFQGSVVRTVNQLFGRAMSWASPMLAEAVVNARLRLTDGTAGPEGVAKPLLARAMGRVMPAEHFARRDKGDYSHDLYHEFAGRRRAMRAWFDDSLLADHGALDMDAVMRVLDEGTQDNLDLFDLERVVELERWSRAAV